ncbi:hypothetical protein WOLCODRAFT_162868 [Wolfiporia cocos MD-104 SS10]|uniref:Cytochrome c oxidase subunit 8, mitochondrial n=1 Tax=Wolfiporia cocos (strain MD-104) TaxID=742152 RepID=A0A2H3JQU6_WOLCO|nr:hypothetical protein WOLCODRAFT_162868 [Wolfiporia cocos MD-104 SS10]
MANGARLFSHAPRLRTMTLLARAGVPLRQAARRSPIATPARFSHGHAEFSPVPFTYKNRKLFAAKVAAYLVGGFAIPFVAAAYQLRKSS